MTASDPRFVGSFPRADAPLDPPFPEIAFLGRSNVGKSSLLNALLGRRIAKVSGTPGKTRAMNVFLIPGDHAYYALDLPGYGYARVSRSDRTAFANLVRHVLARPRLAGVVWLLDVRRDPSVEDREMLERFAQAGTPVLAAITKSDKLPHGRRSVRVRAIEGTLGLDEEQVVVTSARSGDGIPDLREAIDALAAVARS